MSWLIAALSLPIWLAYTLLSLPFYLLGYPICYLLAKREAWEVTKIYPLTFQWKAKWAFLWGNANDGVVGPQWWYLEHTDWPAWKRAFMWSAVRNPINNFCLIPWLHPVIDPARVRFVGNSDDPSLKSDVNRKPVEWSFTWQGLYAGVVWRKQLDATHHRQIRLGWKLLPKDRFGVPDGDHRKARCSFATQVHWNRTAD